MKRLLLGSHGIGALAQLVGGDTRGLRVAFVPAAAEPDAETKPWVQIDREQIRILGCETTTLHLASLDPDGVAEALGEVDVVFVTGGSVIVLKEAAVRCSFGDVARGLVEESKLVYVGTSAGAVFAGPEGLGLVEFRVLAHDDHDDYRARNDATVAANPEQYVIRLRDDEAVLVRGDVATVVDSPVITD